MVCSSQYHMGLSGCMFLCVENLFKTIQYRTWAWLTGYNQRFVANTEIAGCKIKIDFSILGKNSYINQN